MTFKTKDVGISYIISEFRTLLSALNMTNVSGCITRKRFKTILTFPEMLLIIPTPNVISLITQGNVSLIQ
jgi:hypothetical protein